MTFDSETNKITFVNEPELSVDSGAFFAKVLRDVARAPRGGTTAGQRQLIADWALLEAWVDCAGREPTDSDYAKVGAAFRSYLARGRSPSVPLEVAFKRFATVAKEQEWPLVDVPPDVVRVFDRMLATDHAIQSKRAAKATAFGAAMDAVRSTPPSGGRLTIKGRLASLSRVQRAVLALSLAWFVYAYWRTSGSYELFGVWLRVWDSDAFLLNALLPPVCVVIGLKLYRWVARAR